MAIPPSAGNPVVVGPYKRIVGFNWPTVTPPAPTRYIRTQAWLWSLALGDDQLYVDPILPWDGRDYNPTPWLFQEWSIKNWGWQEWPFYGDTEVGGSRYFTRAEVYNEAGELIHDGICSALGITVTKPTLPLIVSVPQWTVRSVSDSAAYPPQTVPVPNPMYLNFYSDGPICKMYCSGFLADPPVQYYRGGIDTDGTGMMTAMKMDLYTTYENFPIDMSGVTATFEGQTYTAIGWKWFQDGFTLEPRVDVLLKTVGT